MIISLRSRESQHFVPHLADRSLDFTDNKQPPSTLSSSSNSHETGGSSDVNREFVRDVLDAPGTLRADTAQECNRTC